MNRIAQRDKAALFQRLHCAPRILVAANAWDAASARIFDAIPYAEANALFRQNADLGKLPAP